MTLLLRWIAGLTNAIANNDTISSTHHRVVTPGRLPLSGPGLVRYQPMMPLERPGQPPECMSLMGFFVGPNESEHLQVAEIARTIGAHLTYTLDRRVDVLGGIPIAMETEPDRLTFLPLSGLPDRSLLAPLEHTNPDALLRPHLKLLVSLPPSDAGVLSAAIDMLYGACLLLDHDLASAYTLVISGIEALSRHFGQPPSEWTAWDKASKWEDFISSNGLTSTQAASLRAQLMQDAQLRLTETFASYGSDRLPASFWDAVWRDWTYEVSMPSGVFSGNGDGVSVPMSGLVPQDRAVLKRSLKKSYIARSGFVHTGERSVEMEGEFKARVIPSRVERLSFPGLRMVLRGLIAAELQDHSSSGGELPDLVYTMA